LTETKIVRVTVTLTPSESKRIIGKAVANMDIVKQTLKEGSVVIGVGSTNSFVAEEITGRKIDKEHYSAGIITPHGWGVTNIAKRLDSLLIKRGEISSIRRADWPKICDQLGSRDVYIKGANAIDQQHNAAVVTADPGGGSLNPSLWRAIKERRLNIIIPVGLEKTIPFSLLELSKKLGDGRVSTWKQMGIPVYKIFLLPGIVVTEIEAFGTLTNVEAIPIASGGIGGAEGSITILIEGHEDQVKKTWDMVNQIKGEPPVKADPQKLT
jgi:hypothetical protein